jgi:predicted GIY-YIG superfamily endonuclease
MPSVALAKEGFFVFLCVARFELMKYVYLLESISHPGNRYIGITSNLKKRLQEHNAGKSPHTAKFRPWRIIIAISFINDRRAEDFERYLKSGSGHAFIKRHF